MDWLPQSPREFVMYYGIAIVLGIAYFLRRRPRQGMRLRLLDGKRTSEIVDPRFSRIEPQTERPLNVVFNYNGHSWDAYEVLGLAAGSSPEKVYEAYLAALAKVDASSQPFIEAAHRAIRAQWDTYKKASEG